MARWLTLAANAAVLVGIVLVIIELDQNRAMMRAQIRHDLATGIVDLLQVPAANPQLADAMHRAMNDQPLTPVERFQVEMRTNALFRYWEDVHYQFRVGLYDESEFSRQREAWRASIARSNWTVAYWCGVRSSYSPEFAVEMEGLMGPGACSGEG